MMEQYAVSKPTLREALRVLETDGLLRIVRGPHGGAIIRQPTTEPAIKAAALVLQCRGTTMGELYDARLMLEVHSPRLVAARDDLGAVLDGLERLAEFESARTSRRRAVLRGHEFHTELMRLTGNRALLVLAEIIESITESATLDTFSVSDEQVGEHLEHGYAEHRALVRLLRAGAVAEAEDLWRTHLINGRDAILDATASRLPVMLHDLVS